MESTPIRDLRRMIEYVNLLDSEEGLGADAANLICRLLSDSVSLRAGLLGLVVLHTDGADDVLWLEDVDANILRVKIQTRIDMLESWYAE